MIVLLLALAWCATPTVASAQVSATQNITVTASVNGRAKLTMSGNAVNFPDADPDVTNPIVSANVLTITANVRTTASGVVTLTAAAGGPLTSGTDTIAINNVAWTGSGTGFNATGTMNSTAQPVATWTGSGTRVGTQTYSLVNSWNYAPGTYSASVTYTLSAP